MEIKDHTNLTKNQLTTLLNINPSTIEKWVKKGLPLKKAHSRLGGRRFNLAILFNWALENKKQEIETELNLVDLDLDELKKRRLELLIETSELNIATLKKKIAPVEEIAQSLEELFLRIKQDLRKIPEKIYIDLIDIKDDVTIKNILLSALDKSLLLLSTKQILKDKNLINDT